ncbi:MAG: signal peptidase I [Eubacteriales bacterium]|nr:signal peptidase I [Eubacteriales bacterium]
MNNEENKDIQNNISSWDANEENVIKEEKTPIFSNSDIRKNTFRTVFDWVYMVVVAAIVAILCNSFLITNSYVPTGSMISTLPIGARLFGSRLAYISSDIKRGDIVVLNYGYICKECGYMYQKKDKNHLEYLSESVRASLSELNNYFDEVCPNCGRKNTNNSKAYFIKRCIAIPGDVVEIKNDYLANTNDFKEIKFRFDGTVKAGHVYINGVKQEETYIYEPMIVDDNFYKSFKFTVPEDGYFLMGDNRNNSEDARFWNQMFVAKKDIIAKAGFVYWPIYKFGLVK